MGHSNEFESSPVDASQLSSSTNPTHKQVDVRYEGIRNFFAGCLGGIACAYVGHPFDTVKVRMQTLHSTEFQGPISCLVQTVQREGIPGLFAGVTPSCAAQIAENAILFLFYGYCQRFVKWVTKEEDLSLFSMACCGGLAACFSTLGLTPTELVKCRLQVQRMAASMATNTATTTPTVHYKGPVDCAVQIVRAEGARGLFRGLASTLLREVPGNFAMFGGYELSRYLLTPEGTNPQDLSPARTMLSGALGGVSLWITIYPLDVVKSRVQVSSGAVGLKVGQVISALYQRSGVRGFYAGLTPCVARAFPANAALFYTVEATKSACDKWWLKKK